MFTDAQKRLFDQVFNGKSETRAAFDGFLTNITVKPKPGVFCAAPETEIPMTDEMQTEGRRAANEWGYHPSLPQVEKIYRAMRRLEPTSFDASDADIENLATALLADYLGCTFGEAVRQLGLQVDIGAHWKKLARAAFDHPGYLPSIEAARRDANQSRAAEVAHLRTQCHELNQLLLGVEDKYQALLKYLLSVEPEMRDALSLLAARDARIAELDTRLAETAKAETPSDVKLSNPPKPFPAGALKSSTTDPRRVGS